MKHVAAKVSIVLVLGLAPFAVASCSSSSSTPFGDADSGSGGGDSSAKDGSSSSDGGTGTDSGSGSETSTGSATIGKTCTPEADGGIGQGDCDTGYVCLSLQDGTNPWCSKTCTQASDHCNDGYTGAGYAACILGVDTTDYCGVICLDETDGGVCPAGKCTGTCPGTLACTSVVNGTSGEVGKSCQ